MATKVRDMRPPLAMVHIVEGRASAEAFAAHRGWTVFTTVPCKNGHGVWLAKGVRTMPPDSEFRPVRLFPNEFEEMVTVTCGWGNNTHTHTVSKAVAKVYHTHEALAKNDRSPSEESEEPYEG